MLDTLEQEIKKFCKLGIDLDFLSQSKNLELKNTQSYKF
jgi:hypothetical protein